MTKTSQKKNNSASKSKNNKDDEKQSKNLRPISDSDELQKPKRRLRKINRRQSSDQDFIPGHSDQQFEDDIQNVDDPQSYERFKQQDDDDIKKEKQQEQNKVKRKKLKNNQQIDKFMSNMGKKEKPQKQKKKQQQPNVQMNLSQMFNMQKLKKQQRQKSPSPEPQQSQIQNQDSIDQDDLLMKRMQAQSKVYELQGKVAQNTSQDQLIQQAIKLSLQSAKKQKKAQDQQVDLNDFQFGNVAPNRFSKNVQNPTKQQQRHRNVHKNQPKKKDEGKMSIQKSRQISSQVQQKKPKNKSASKKNVSKKQPKQGPLAGQYVVFTGQFQPYTKDQIIELCQKLGAETPSGITKKTTVLLQGSYIVDTWKRRIQQDINTTRKSKDAIQKGVRIVANKDVDDFFIQKTGKSLQEHFRKDPKKLDGFVQKEKPDDTNVKMDIQITNKEKVVKSKQTGFGVLWTQKYKPTTLDEVIGQSVQIRQLRQWLKDWEDVVLRGNKKDAEPVRGFLPAGTINSRAALLSGDPGLGKTTTARLLAQQLGYSITQFNASDIRNKKGVQLLQAGSYGIHQGTRSLVKNLIIMDEVDGMSKGDRGGITQIIGMIKQTTVPIICICNDRQSQKIRSLAGHCFDIKFHKPDKRLIIKRLHEIVENQGGKVTDLVLTRIVETFQNDMRQILTYLQLMFKTKSGQLEAKDINQSMNFTKDNAVMLTHFDATRKLLNRLQLNQMTTRQKLDCYFIDSEFVPIMVHQNYIASMKKGKLDKKQFHKFVKATDAFVLGDLMDTRIRKQQDWGLMPSVGFMTAVYPSEMVGQSLGFPQFPSWLGKFSSQRKHKRLLKQLRQTIHCQYPSTIKSIRYGLSEILYQEMNYLLKNDNVEEALDLMQTYNLTPTIMNEVLLQLQFNPQKNVLFPNVTTSTKTKLTKAFNRRHEQAKAKGKTKKVAAIQPQHHKYNQILQQMSDDDFINDEEQQNVQNQNSQMVDQKVQKKLSKKNTKGGAKKK